MSEKPHTIQAGALSEPQRRQGQAALIRTALTLTVSSLCTFGAVGTLFLMSLGARPIHVGLLQTTMQVSLLGQVLGLYLMPRVGKVRLFARGDVLQFIPLGLLIGLAVLAGDSSAAIYLALACYAAVLAIRLTSHAGWWPLLQDNTSEQGRGRFFARMRTRMRILEIILPLAIGAYLGKNPPPIKFALPFSVGAAAVALGVWFIRAVPETPLAAPTVNVWVRLRLAWRVRAVRRCLLFLSADALFQSLLIPFWIVMLKQRGLPAGQIVWLPALAAAGHIGGLGLAGWAVDHYGGRSVLSISLPCKAALGLAWLLLPVEPAWLLLWGAGFYCLWGFVFGTFFMGRTWVLMQAVPDVYQADSFTLTVLSLGIAGAIGSLLGGFIFDYLTHHPRSFAGFDGRVLYLAGVQLAWISIWLAKLGLVGHDKQTSARRLMAILWRWLLQRPRAA